MPQSVLTTQKTRTVKVERSLAVTTIMVAAAQSCRPSAPPQAGAPDDDAATEGMEQLQARQLADLYNVRSCLLACAAASCLVGEWDGECCRGRGAPSRCLLRPEPRLLLDNNKLED